MAPKKTAPSKDHIAWKMITSLSYRAAQQRTRRDAVGTMYWAETSAKHYLYTKRTEDSWLCFGGRSVEACLEDLAKRPGKGGPANDHLIANGIAVSPNDKQKRIVRTAMVGTARAKHGARLSLRLSPNEMWNVLAARGADVIRRPVSRSDVKAAETALGFAFPRSYVDLVTRHGAPAIGPRAKRAESLSFAVLVPSEVVRLTKRMRRIDADMFEDPNSYPRVKAQLANAVLFQLGAEPSDGYVFLVDTAKAEREPVVAEFAYDYLEDLDWKRSSKVVFASLAAATLEVARQIEEKWSLR